MNNFPDRMKSIEKMGAKSDTFTATKLCSCLSISYLGQPCSYLTKNTLFSCFCSCFAVTLHVENGRPAWAAGWPSRATRCSMPIMMRRAVSMV